MSDIWLATGEATVLDVGPEAVSLGRVRSLGCFVGLVGRGEDLEDVAGHRLLTALLRLLGKPEWPRVPGQLDSEASGLLFHQGLQRPADLVGIPVKQARHVATALELGGEPDVITHRWWRG